MFGSENIFFAPLKIMTNQKSPAHFWARFSGHVPLVMKISAKDAGQSFAPIYVVDRPCPEKRAQKCAGDFSVPYIDIFAPLFLDHAQHIVVTYCGNIVERHHTYYHMVLCTLCTYTRILYV